MTSSIKTFISSTVVVLATSVAASAMAQSPAAPTAPASGPRHHGKGIKDLDVNKDKLISRDEAKGRPHLTKRFDAIDSNKDGQLSRNEMQAYRRAHKGEHMGQGTNRPKS